MSFIEPPKIKRGELNRIGAAIRAGELSSADAVYFEQWRASHAYVINKFQARLRQKAKKYNGAVATRLKRRVTIIDKLSREPGMNLSRMHDIAGCRVILDNTARLAEFREEVLRTRAKHRLLSGGEKYNYIISPKKSGYRGIHDVYENTGLSDFSLPWNGLRIEIQYRTKAQHAWATAVESFDLFSKQRTKFSDASVPIIEWFVHASEVVARQAEGSSGPLPSLTDSELAERFVQLESRAKVFDTMRQFPILSDETRRTGDSYIICYRYGALLSEENPLIIERHEVWQKSINRYFEMEREYGDSADIVLVRSGTIFSFRQAYQNYFLDVREFMSIIRSWSRNWVGSNGGVFGA